MAYNTKLPIPVPTPFGVVPKPPERQRVSAYTAPNMVGYGQGGSYSPAALAGGGVGTNRPGSLGYKELVSPWAESWNKNYQEASGPAPYQGDWRQGVAQAMTLGNRDYEGDLRRFGQEDVERQITSADNQLGALGMRELALREDVQADRGKARADASTRAMIESQGIKQNALQTMQGILSAASGVELSRINQMIQAANAGSNQYNAFQSLAIPLQQQAAAKREKNKYGGYNSQAELTAANNAKMGVR